MAKAATSTRRYDRPRDLRRRWVLGLVGEMTTYYVVHDRGTRYTQVQAESLIYVYAYANYKWGKMHFDPIKNARPSTTGYVVYDSVRDMERVFPKASWASLVEIPYDKQGSLDPYLPEVQP